jgi:hypothetical protein
MRRCSRTSMFGCAVAHPPGRRAAHRVRAPGFPYLAPASPRFQQQLGLSLFQPGCLLCPEPHLPPTPSLLKVRLTNLSGDNVQDASSAQANGRCSYYIYPTWYILHTIDSVKPPAEIGCVSRCSPPVHRVPRRLVSPAPPSRSSPLPPASLSASTQPPPPPEVECTRSPEDGGQGGGM